ncbi:hypothetical protein [Facklamia sp. 7083-14-GEN3]|uniref:hypothetical protein n=1 Tax=Facklamia sp. 7083-14-GEN3 TaxID=2973478 RepID=UPI00215D2781|nr:hypothetical protein [Facklamia sp. 7083-14-GEN3]MCR8969073.1 hypothetical protein [Facklamia sp. 7083-14-GEN3]
MLNEKNFKDWLFRYQYVYKIRNNNKSKERFIKALVTDLFKWRNDIQVIEYGENKKNKLKNIYVGNIEKADRIICAHYDTPIKNLGSYIFFDKTKAKTQTTLFIFISSLLMVLVGLLLTLGYKELALTNFSLFSLPTLIIGLFYAFYFYFLNKIANGIAERQNLIRNTSSILALLALSKEIDDQKTAFIFFDRGIYGNLGLKMLDKEKIKDASIYILDSVGTDAPLYLVGNRFTKNQANKAGILTFFQNSFKYNYLISARTSEENSIEKFYLSRKDLKQKELNITNIEKIVHLFTNNIL